MSSQLIRSGECRKFSPNIFNKTKCTNCFRQKEEHSAEALESNRATRKVAKCGYLFVAPGWDFSNPINRTKRWQRRWFVLYDDGELSYSLDEHPETVPQASIDMNKVVEVAAADDITGNPYSIAITAPDIVHFVKGTSREEARFWSDVLSVFPRSKGRHKRNATFPGTQPSTKSNIIIHSPHLRGNEPANESVRNQYNTRISTPVWEGDDVFPTKESGTPSPKSSPIEQIPQNNSSPEPRKVYMGSPPTRDKMDEKVRSRRVVNREKRGLKTGRSFSEDITKMVPTWQDKPSNQGHLDVSHRLLIEEYETECKLKDIADSITRPRSRPLPPSSQQHCIEPTRDGDVTSHKQVRGDPDGCGLDPSTMRYSPSDLRVDLPAEELLNIKRGWLMKQGQDKEWSKHWFVQRGHGLLYYRDPKAEDQGILDGVIDLSGISSVIESQVQRNYGFQITTWDGRQITLSALTGGIRANWLSALRKAAGLNESPLELSSPTQEQDSIVSSTPRSMLFSSDDEYRTASENGRRESGEWGEALPPSPPLNRTPMSKVKERARGVSKWRGMGSKRSRSSPPNSRRSTLDSVSSQELSSACSFKAKENEDKTPYSSFVEKEVRHEEIVQKLRTPEVAALEKKVEDLMKSQGETEKQRAKDSAELEALKSRYVEEKCKWERAIQIFETELEDANSRCANLCAELTENKDVEKKLRSDLQRLEMRLTCAIEENEALYLRVKELEKPISTARDRARSVDSLSDLTNIDLDLNLEQLDKERIAEEYMDLRTRFEKAVSEIRALKRELRESQAAQDWLELSVVSARQEAKGLNEEAEASSKLMAARIQDLATKLSTAEKQIRTLKQKLTKTDTKEKRRSLSLKGRESFSICKELEEKLAELETRMNVIDPSSPSVPIHPAPLAVEEDTKKMDKVSARLRRKSLDSATSSEPLKVLLRLRNLEAKVSQVGSSDSKKVELKLFNGECDEADGSQKPEVFNEVKKMENLLRAKLVVLAKKKETLVSAGQWTNEAKLNLLAEKLAYESVLIGRLHDAVMETRNLDLSDAERLITCLDSKISGGKPSMETSLDYLVKSLAKHLTQQTVKRVNRKPKERKKADSALTELLSKKASIDSKVDQYINEVVEKLAHAFAVESLGDMGSDKAREKIQSTAIQSMAREAVNQELIQEEITQVLNQCTQTYRNYVESENQSRFAGIVKERANLELWGSLADENLNNNIGVAIRKLQDAYSAKLLSLKSEKTGVSSSEEDESKSRELLQHFIDVVAHKSLLDARVSVLSSGDYTESDASEPAPFEENSLLSEIQFLYVKFCRELSQESKDEERLKDVIERMSKEVYFLARILNPESSFHKVDKCETIADNWVDLMCKKCENLKEKLVSMQKFAEDKKECNSCAVLQQELSRIENICKSEVSELEKKQESELSRVQCEFEEQKANLVRHYREEEEKLRDKNWQLEKQIESLNSEYTQQTEDLRNVYSKTLSTFNSEIEEEENLKQRYQAEIQHLRNVCEKGLVGMENSHRRQIAELQAKHEQELATLRQEKDQALAEETHATLAALDAMRKAHEAEVQKEVAKFKAEFVNKIQSNQDLSALHKQHQAEMEEIKREILSLSDKYSIKCVESASLEDKLRAANQQLATAHQHIVQLDARNRQLRAHLLVDSNSDSVPRLHEHTHGVGVPSSQPRVVNVIPKTKGPSGSTASPKSSLRIVQAMEPSPLPKAEVNRCPSLSLSGMVSKRREEFERRFTAPAACTPTSRATLV